MRMTILALAAVALVTGCTGATTNVAPTVTSVSVAPASGSALSVVNAFRSAEGRAPLSRSSALQTVAERHAADMARNGFFSHTGSDGSSVGDRARAAGYGFCFIAENIAKGQGDLAAVMQSWTGSSGHRRNLLASKAREMGLARASGTVWVMVLGAPG